MKNAKNGLNWSLMAAVLLFNFFVGRFILSFIPLEIKVWLILVFDLILLYFINDRLIIFFQKKLSWFGQFKWLPVLLGLFLLLLSYRSVSLLPPGASGGTCQELTQSTIASTPVVFSINPKSAIQGETVTIKGTNFVNSSDPNLLVYKVLFNNQVMPIEEWSDKEIKVIVPVELPVGSGTIRVVKRVQKEDKQFKLTSNTLKFTRLDPAKDVFGRIRRKINSLLNKQ